MAKALAPMTLGLVMLGACASIERISTEQGRANSGETERVLYDNRAEILSFVNQSGKGGVLVFTENEAGTVKLMLPGDSPLEAWLSYASRGRSGSISSLPLPSQISPTVAYIYAGDQTAKNHLVSFRELDNDVKQYYGLSSAMSRIGSDMQDLRDIVILIGMSDQQQNDNVSKLHASFDTLSDNFDTLKRSLDDLTESQGDMRQDIMARLSDLGDEIERIGALIDQLQ